MAKKGLVFYYDWYEQLSVLPAEELKAVIGALIKYHKDDVYPDKISPLADMAIGFIIPQIKRLKEKAEYGKAGGRPRTKPSKEEKCAPVCAKEEVDASHINKEVECGSYINKEEFGTSEPQTKGKDNLTFTGEASGNSNLEPQPEGKQKAAFGEFKNVLLTQGEYEEIKKKYPAEYRRLIEDLSYYMKSKGDTFASHYGAILNRQRYNNINSPPPITSTFDTDDFFQAALERSNRKMKERLSRAQ